MTLGVGFMAHGWAKWNPWASGFRRGPKLDFIHGKVAALDDAVAAFNPTERIKGKTIIRVHP